MVSQRFLLLQEFAALRVRQTRLDHSQFQAGELAIEELVAQPFCDVGKLLGTIGDGALFGDRLGDEPARGTVRNFREQRGHVQVPAVGLGPQPERNDLAHRAVLNPVQVQMRNRPGQQLVVEQKEFQEPELLC